MTMASDSNKTDYYEKVPTYEEAVGIEQVKLKVTEPPEVGFGVRHIQTIILFASLAIGFITRAHLGMTVVAMTDVKYQCINSSNVFNSTYVNVDTNYIKSDFTNLTLVDEDFTDLESRTSTVELTTEHSLVVDAFESETSRRQIIIPNEGTVYQVYAWTKSQQEMVLSSFFIGYSIMMFPMGLISQRYGGKIPLQVALLANGVMTFITPWVAIVGGWMAVCVCRIIQGLTQAAYYPSLHTLLAKWVPLKERGRLSTYVYTGTTFGTVLGFQISGLLAGSSWGWPSIFWLTGILNIINLILLTYLGAVTPADHPNISEAEKMFIMGNAYYDEKPKLLKTPWLSIVKSKHVWGLYATQIGSALGFIFLLVQTPTYMFHILNVDIKKSGIYSSLPFIAMYFTGLAFGFISDFCTNRKILSIKNARRLSNSIAMIGPAIFMSACSFTTNTILAVAFLVLSMGMHAGVHTGWMINHIDLAPNFSGTIMAAGNTLGNVCALGLPVLVSVLVTDVKNQSQWRILFILMSVISFVANAVFFYLMSSETQPWNQPDDLKKGKKETT